MHNNFLFKSSVYGVDEHNFVLRKIIHLFFGFILMFLFYLDFYLQEILIGLLLVGCILSFFVKYSHLPLISYLVSHLGKEDEHPGMGLFLFAISILTLTFFATPKIVLTSLILLTLVDSLGTILGISYGFIPVPFLKNKHIEGRLISLFVCTLLLFYCLNFGVILSLFLCTLVILIEAIDFKIGHFTLDDNVLIPLTVFLVLNFI